MKQNTQCHKDGRVGDSHVKESNNSVGVRYTVYSHTLYFTKNLLYFTGNPLKKYTLLYYFTLYTSAPAKERNNRLRNDTNKKI